MIFAGIRAVVYGAGASGIAAYDLLTGKGAKAVIYDDRPSAERATDSIGVFNDAELIVLSPGVTHKDFISDAKLEGKTVMSELQLASSVCVAEQIAVTGTNGKTTATMLIDAILRRAGKRSYAVGNIGKPFSSVADMLDVDDVAVIEASSFQLESSAGFSPDTAVILNIEPDHLDRHGNMAKYVAAKANIFLGQGEQDSVVYNDDDEIVRALIPEMPSRKIPFSLTHTLKEGAYLSSGFICYNREPIVALEDIDMNGKELQNALAATAVCMSRGISAYCVASAISEFKRPEFRRQYIGKTEGIEVYNDSKATNVSACLAACERGEDTILMLGGAKMGEDFDALFSKLPRSVKAICVCGDNADDILTAAKKIGFENIREFPDLRSSLESAVEEAKKCGAARVLFSPSSKSFDRYRDFEDRGRRFNACARELGVR